jgi:hypothetical protein
MNPRIIHVRHVADYRLELTFVDGTRGEVDLRDRVVVAAACSWRLRTWRISHKCVSTRKSGRTLCPDVLYGCVRAGRLLPRCRIDPAKKETPDPFILST